MASGTMLSLASESIPVAGILPLDAVTALRCVFSNELLVGAACKLSCMTQRNCYRVDQLKC